MNDIICHIGFPKTGTTYLQKKIFPEIENINYVTQGKIIHLLNDIIRKDDSFYDQDKISAEFMQLHDSNSNLLLSHEVLSGFHIKNEFSNRSQIARRLKSSGVNKIIINIRNQYDILESSYKEYIKSGGVLKVADFFSFNNNRRPYLYIDYFNYKMIVDLYSEIFGAENVLVLQFEKMFSNDSDFNQQLADFLNIEKIDVRSSANVKVNKSISNFSTKLLRIINHFTYNNYRPSSLIHKKISTHFFLRILQRIDKIKDKDKLISNYKEEIHSHFSSSNTYLKEKYNIDLHEKYYTSDS